MTTLNQTAGDELHPVDQHAVAPQGLRPHRLLRDRLLILIIALVSWEAIVRLGVIDEFFIATPSQTLTAASELLRTPELRKVFINTIAVIGLAFTIGASTAVLVGVWMGLVARAYRAFLPFVSLAMSTPKIIFLPLVVVIFGIGDLSKVVYGSISAFFFTIPSVAAAVRMIDPRFLLVTRSLGASRVERFLHLVIPGALPGIVTGLWFGMKHALLSVLVAELFISQSGIGFWINRYTASFQVDKVYALILSLSVIAIAIGWGFRSLEQRLARWQQRGN